MPKTAQRLKAFLQPLYLLTLDWLYVWQWQIRGLCLPADPHEFERPPEAKPAAIVMIPGIYESWKFMRPLSHALYKEDFPVYVVTGLGLNTGTIQDMARKVQATIHDIDSPNVYLVAHSKGGLIGKYVLAKHNADGRVRHVIAINTPFAGSVYAHFAPVRGIRNLSPKDATLKQLIANEEMNRHITSVYSRFDTHVPDGSELAGATNLRIETYGHFRILSDAQVIQKILSVLRESLAADR